MWITNMATWTHYRSSYKEEQLPIKLDYTPSYSSIHSTNRTRKILQKNIKQRQTSRWPRTTMERRAINFSWAYSFHLGTTSAHWLSMGVWIYFYITSTQGIIMFFLFLCFSCLLIYLTICATCPDTCRHRVLLPFYLHFYSSQVQMCHNFTG